MALIPLVAVWVVRQMDEAQHGYAVQCWILDLEQWSSGQ